MESTPCLTDTISNNDVTTTTQQKSTTGGRAQQAVSITNIKRDRDK